MGFGSFAKARLTRKVAPDWVAIANVNVSDPMGAAPMGTAPMETAPIGAALIESQSYAAQH